MFHNAKKKTWFAKLSLPDGNINLYTIELKWTGCFPDRYQLLVNGQEIAHQFSPNYFSPLCGSGGVYEWEQDYHSFMLIQSSLDFRCYMLIIDGIDCETGLEFTRYLKTKGFQYFTIGIFMFIAAITPTILKVLGMGLQLGLGEVTYCLAAVGLVHVIIGLLCFMKSNSYRRKTIPINYNTGFNA